MVLEMDQEVTNEIDLDKLAAGSVIEVKTLNHSYEVEKREADQVLISGHPSFCPKPVTVHLNRARVIEVGHRMEFEHPEFGVVGTSRVLEIRQR
jgi:hypothetical protein